MRRGFLPLTMLLVGRTVINRRWFSVLGIWLLAFWLVAAMRFPETGAVERSSWDLYLSLMNNWMTVGYLLLPAFVLLVGDIVAEDLRNRYGWLLISRSTRGSWWFATCCTVVATSFAYQVALVVATALAGFAFGLAPTADLANIDPGAYALYPALGSEVSLAVRIGGLLMHQALAFAAIALVLVALTLRWRNPVLPLAIVVGLEILDWVFTQRSSIVSLISPGRRLIEGVHVAPPGTVPPFSVQQTVTYFAVMLLAACLAGAVAAYWTDC